MHIYINFGIISFNLQSITWMKFFYCFHLTNGKVEDRNGEFSSLLKWIPANCFIQSHCSIKFSFNCENKRQETAFIPRSNLYWSFHWGRSPQLSLVSMKTKNFSGPVHCHSTLGRELEHLRNVCVCILALLMVEELQNKRYYDKKEVKGTLEILGVLKQF